jgi:hypothetical protein
VDGRWRFGDRWVVTGSALASETTFRGGEQAVDGAAFASGDFQTRHVYANLTGDYTGRDFRMENGRLATADSMGGGGVLGFDIYPKIGFIPKIWFAPIDASLGWMTDGRMRLLAVTPNLEILTSNGLAFYTELAHTRELYFAEELEYDRLYLDLNGPIGRRIDFAIYCETGQGPYYFSDEPQIGWVNESGGTLELMPIPEIRFSFSPTWEQLRIDGTTVYDGFVARAKLETFTSAHTWQRLIIDRNTFDDSVDAELLVAWEGTPGNAFYLGGSLGTPGLLDASVEGGAVYWQVFAKASWVFWI